RQVIETLDVPAADRLGGLKVFRLKYASAKNLAEILQGLVSGQAVNSNSNSGSTSSNSSSLSSGSNLNNNNTTTGSSSNTSSGIQLNTGMNNEQGGITSFNGNGVSIIADTTRSEERRVGKECRIG